MAWLVRSHESYFPNDHGCFVSEKLYKIILDRWGSLYKFLSFILAWYSNRFRWNAPRAFTKSLFFFLFTNALFLVEVEASERFARLQWSDHPSLYPSKPAKEINSNRTSFVSLIRCSNLSSSVPRCPRGQFSFSSSFSPPPSTIFQRLFSNASPSVHRFPFPTLPSISSPFARAHRPYPIAIFLARPSIFLRTVSLAPLQGNRPNADAAGAHPAKIAPLSRRPIRPGTYVRTSATFAIGNFPLHP